MFALSTAHVGLALRELLDGFVFQLQSTPGGPPVFFRENVFPKRKSIYIFNVSFIPLTKSQPVYMISHNYDARLCWVTPCWYGGYTLYMGVIGLSPLHLSVTVILLISLDSEWYFN